MKINALPLLFAALMLSALPALAQKISITGSDTMAQLNQKWAQEFMKAYPDIKVEVSGGGSGIGIAALRNGTTDVAAASRLIKSKETQDFLVGLNVKPVQIEVALDGVVVFVNEKNKIESLSLTQVEKIYRGEITNWKEVGGADQNIVLYGREANSGTYGFVKEVVLKEKDFSAKTQTLAGTAAVYDAVGKDPAGVGYGGIGYAHGVRELKIKLDDKPETVAIAPTLENVAKGTYPLSRALFYYTNPKNANANVETYIKWVRSAAGQKHVELVGFVPVPANYVSPSATASAAPAPAPAPAPAAAEVRPTVSTPKAPVHSHPQVVPVVTSSSTGRPMTATNVRPAAAEPAPAPTATTAAAPAAEPAAAPAPAPAEAPAPAPVAASTIIPAGPITAEQLAQIRTALVEREKSVAAREMDVAEREDSVAKREGAVTAREQALLPKRYQGTRRYGQR